MGQFDFFAYINRMKYIYRWGLMRNTDSENIQEHSLSVAVLAHGLCLMQNKYFTKDGGKILSPERACLYGVFHDANEIITGDLPTPVKYYNPEIKESYRALEDVSKNRLLGMLPEEMQSEYKKILFYEEDDKDYYPIVKAADRLSAYIKCEEEVKAGNREFVQAKDTIMQSMKDMKLPVLDYFIENYLHSFSLSLDELSN